MRCWPQPDAINSASLGLKETVNHISYSGKQPQQLHPREHLISRAKARRWRKKRKHRKKCSDVNFNDRLSSGTGASKQRSPAKEKEDGETSVWMSSVCSNRFLHLRETLLVLLASRLLPSGNTEEMSSFSVFRGPILFMCRCRSRK